MNTGTYFIITLFIEKWTFTACKNRLQDVKKFKIKKDKVSFGRKLTWHLKKLQHSAILSAANLGGKTFQLALFNARADCLANPDVIIQCGEGSHTGSYIESISSKLLSCLFFIELETVPRFYTSPEVCAIVIRCRISPGHGLLDLLSKLQHINACFYYKGSEGKERKALVCTKSVLDSCRNYRPFCRQLKVAALSLNTAISVRVDGIDGNKHSISNCPYPLKKLVLDQGLEAPFGSRQHSSLFSRDVLANGERKQVDLEIDALIKTLNRVA